MFNGVGNNFPILFLWLAVQWMMLAWRLFCFGFFSSRPKQLLVQFYSQETHDAFVPSKFGFKITDYFTVCGEFEQVVKTTFLVLNGIGQFFSPNSLSIPS